MAEGLPVGLNVLEGIEPEAHPIFPEEASPKNLEEEVADGTSNYEAMQD